MANYFKILTNRVRGGSSIWTDSTPSSVIVNSEFFGSGSIATATLDSVGVNSVQCGVFSSCHISTTSQHLSIINNTSTVDTRVGATYSSIRISNQDANVIIRSVAGVTVQSQGVIVGNSNGSARVSVSVNVSHQNVKAFNVGCLLKASSYRTASTQQVKVYNYNASVGAKATTSVGLVNIINNPTTAFGAKAVKVTTLTSVGSVLNSSVSISDNAKILVDTDTLLFDNNTLSVKGSVYKTVNKDSGKVSNLVVGYRIIDISQNDIIELPSVCTNEVNLLSLLNNEYIDESIITTSFQGNSLISNTIDFNSTITNSILLNSIIK